ncbi:FHA domain-containing protein [Nocardia aurantia]|uniref:FHA domain-containing protein n=1 Tax=Nocardia aurantia TaxID=2585199 RepID=A0A7K0DI43_9NOCA|nr:FHA domain-containing protein [Nocardia aurantia]MQY25298.1 hypothetical protein [Nocardia aurantia]
MADGIRKDFDWGSFGEMLVAGTVGGVAGAEVGRRLAPVVIERLSGRATTVLGRLVTHVGGTVVIGGAGGVTGGVAGVVPSLIIHHGDIHSLGDVYRQVRAAVVTGFGGGFVGAAFSSLRVHQAGRAAMRDGFDTDVAARQRAFGTKIDALLRSGAVPEIEVIKQPRTPGDSARLVERLVFPDGTAVIHKVVADPQHAHAEYLTSLVGDAAGANVPAVHVVGRDVYMEVAPGETAVAAYPRDWSPHERFLNTPAGVRLGVLDALVRPLDRNSENWMVAPDADVWAIDNSLAFHNSEYADRRMSPFAEHFLERAPDGSVVWRDHSLTSAEVQEVRARVEDLRPAFVAAGRTDWHDVVLHRLDAMADHSVDVVAARRADGPPPPPAHTLAENGSSPRNSEDPRTGARRDVSAGPVRDRPALAGEDGPPGGTGRSAGPRPADAAPAEETPGNAQPRQPRPETDAPPDALPVEPERVVDRSAFDESLRDGPPTRPLPREEPEVVPPEEDPHTPRPAPDAPGMTMNYRHPDGGHVELVLTTPDGARLPLRLIPGREYVLGRGPGAVLHGVATEYVSNRHAVIKVDDAGHVFVRDENSMNGTFVDGKQLVAGGWVRVYDGQDLRLSRHLEVGLHFQRQMTEVRLFGDEGPNLKIYRNQEIPIGRAMVHPDASGRSMISAKHAVLGMDDLGRVWIKDVGSKNGTRVNGEKLVTGQPRYLEPGDSVRLGGYSGEAEFLPPGASRDANPVRFLIRGADGVALSARLEPGQWVHVGTDPRSPLAEQLGGVRGVAPRHAVVGLDHDGRLWVRADRSSDGVWVNGDRIETGQRVSITEGDNVGFGPDFRGTAHLGADAHVPAAEIRFLDSFNGSIRLEPGDEHTIDLRSLHGDAGPINLQYVNGKPVVIPNPGDEIILGRDLDGRMWIRSQDPQLLSYEVKVGDELLTPGEKRYLNPEDRLTFGRNDAELRVAGADPLVVRLTDDEHATPLVLRPGEEMRIGRTPGSLLADRLAGHDSVLPHHATVYRDVFGDVMLRAEPSEGGTWVNNVRVDPDTPVKLQPGDRIRFGDWAGAALFDGEGGRTVVRESIGVKLNGRHGDLALDLVPGGEPVLFGRGAPDSVLPQDLPRIGELSRKHASMGAYSSGRIWIRDEGSSYHTFVNGIRIPPDTKVILKPGDHVVFSDPDAFEFTVSYPPVDGGLFLNVMDRTPQTAGMVEQLARIPARVYARVSEHMNAVPGGGIVIGNRQMLDLPGSDSLRGSTPYGRKPGTSWNTVRGVYLGGPRRILINSGGSGGSSNVVWHEFGHAADAAHGTGGRWLSDGPEWMAIHNDMMQKLPHRPGWNSYYKMPSEAFAEAFTAWMHGGTKELKKFTLGDARLAASMKDYFDSVFG